MTLQTDGPRIASRALFDDTTPHETTPAGSRTWIMRGGNFAVAYTDGKAGDVIARTNPDEYFVYVVEGEITLLAAGAESPAGVRSVSIMPAGAGSVRLDTDARIVTVVSILATDLVASAGNHAAYDGAGQDYAPFRAPAAPAITRPPRTYRLDDYADRKMRLFRCENVMVNVFDHAQPRSTTALTPHSHDDFEQGSFAVAGEWMHHLRRPWTPDMAEWHDDEHLDIGSPSLVVIPARMIHTSRSTNPGYAQLLDVFGPPRADFIAQGLVVNAGEYADDAALVEKVVA